MTCPTNNTHVLRYDGPEYDVVCTECGVSLAALQQMFGLPVVVDGGGEILAGVEQPIVRSDVITGMAWLSVKATIQAVYGGPGPLGDRR
jgi:hypothetical protein